MTSTRRHWEYNLIGQIQRKQRIKPDQTRQMIEITDEQPDRSPSQTSIAGVTEMDLAAREAKEMPSKVELSLRIDDMTPRGIGQEAGDAGADEEEELLTQSPALLGVVDPDMIKSPSLLATAKQASDSSVSRRKLTGLVARDTQVFEVKDFGREDDLLLNDDGSVDAGNDLLDLSTPQLLKKVPAQKPVQVNDEWSKYKVMSILGEGSYGTVYKVSLQSSGLLLSKSRKLSGEQATSENAPCLPSLGRKQSQQLLVIKELQTDQMPRLEALQALNEIEIHGRLANCPFIVSYVDSFISGSNKVNIVMEYCSGGDLQGMLRTRRQKNRPLQEALIVRYFLQMCLGLHAMHKKGILHRDLKAQNVFLTSKQDEVRIGDFGLAKLLPDQSTQEPASGGGPKKETCETQKTQQSNLRLVTSSKDSEQPESTGRVGTPFYLAPELIASFESKAAEQEQPQHPYSTKSDLWALGVIVYELCSLRKPFVGANEAELYQKVRESKPAGVSNVSHQLMQLVQGLLTKDPSKRLSLSDIFGTDYVKSKAQALRIALPSVLKQRHPTAAARFQEGFKKLVTKQQNQMRLLHQPTNLSGSARADLSHRRKQLANKNPQEEKKPINADIQLSGPRLRETSKRRLSAVKSLPKLEQPQPHTSQPQLLSHSQSVFLKAPAPTKKLMPLKSKASKRTSNKLGMPLLSCSNQHQSIEQLPKQKSLQHLRVGKAFKALSPRTSVKENNGQDVPLAEARLKQGQTKQGPQQPPRLKSSAQRSFSIYSAALPLPPKTTHGGVKQIGMMSRTSTFSKASPAGIGTIKSSNATKPLPLIRPQTVKLDGKQANTKILLSLNNLTLSPSSRAHTLRKSGGASTQVLDQTSASRNNAAPQSLTTTSKTPAAKVGAQALLLCKEQSHKTATIDSKQGQNESEIQPKVPDFDPMLLQSKSEILDKPAGSSAVLTSLLSTKLRRARNQQQPIGPSQFKAASPISMARHVRPKKENLLVSTSRRSATNKDQSASNFSQTQVVVAGSAIYSKKVAGGGATGKQTTMKPSLTKKFNQLLEQAHRSSHGKVVFKQQKPAN